MVLIVISGVFALLFIISVLINLLRGRRETGFWDTLFVFTATITGVWALSNADSEPLISSGLRVIAIVLLVFGLLILIADMLRRERNLSRSKGLLGFGGGLLLAVSLVVTPVMGGLVSLLPNFSTRPAQAVGMANAGDSTAFAQTLEAETGLTVVEVSARLENGETLASLVQAHGGDTERLKTALETAIRAQMEAAVAQGMMPQAQADMLLNNVSNIAEQAMTGQLPAEMFQRVIGGLLSDAPAVTPLAGAPPFSEPQNGDRQGMPSNMAFGRMQDATETPDAPEIAAVPTTTPPPPRPLLPTPTPTNTPFPLIRATPGAAENTAEAHEEQGIAETADTAVTCQGVVTNNLNLRAEPDSASERLLTLPYSTMVVLDARSADSTWWATTYEGQPGWLLAEYVELISDCTTLPVRD